MPFLEAIRQFRLEEGKGNTALVHVTYVPFLETVQQQKSKPTQHSVRALQGMGLQPDFIVCRSEEPLSEDVRRKLSLYCNVPPEAVISNPNMEVIYKLPLLFEEQRLGEYLCKILSLPPRKPSLEKWSRLVSLYENARETVRIAMPGKYTQIVDSYISINEAIRHAAASLGAKPSIEWIDTTSFEEDPGSVEVLENFDGILLTPGFGMRGVEGMILSAEYAIERRIPYLGICFGGQLLFVAFCRSILGLKNANSSEVNPSAPHLVVDLLPEQRKLRNKGGTMRLGGHKVYLVRGTKLWDAYKQDVVVERFRHRYHIIPEYARKAEEAGMKVSAYDETGRIINAIELEDGWIVGVQFHPEFKSRPDNPSPVYKAFIRESLKRRKGG